MVSKRCKKRVVVAASGGVDSSCVLALLKKKGFDVIAVSIKTWPKEECGAGSGRSCCSLEAITRARAVAERLEVPHYVLDFNEEFKRQVIDYFCREYLKGHTPNPCIICNEKIKFDLLLRKAKELGADFVATGHYAGVRFDNAKKRFILTEGYDKHKDQSYFLFSLSQEQLAHVIFPLERFTKERTRRLAKTMGLKTHDALSSQDICFVQDMHYTEYLRKKAGVEIKDGDIVDRAGKVMGRHKGIPFYTIGQRRGLGIGYKEPLYVIGIDIKGNRVVAGPKRDVLKRSFIADRLNWVSAEKVEGPLRIKAKIRYNHKMSPATVTKLSDAEVQVDFDRPQEAPTPGQAVVFYDEGLVVGGGWIKECI